MNIQSSNIIDKIQNEFNLPLSSIIRFIKQAPYMYKFYTIEKRHGGQREIASPTKSLKIIQRYICNNFLNEFPVHENACAYLKGKNILTHAKKHVEQKYLLKMDFCDFFNNILDTDLTNFLNDTKKFTQKEIEILVYILCCYNRKKNQMYLSIGAPSSPLVSNIIMYNFDQKITEFCQKNGISYSRYADDLAFSTNKPHVLNQELYPYLENLLNDIKIPNSLVINSDKTVYTSQKFRRQLTGLVLSNDGSISIGRAKKRTLRAMAHQYEKLENSQRNKLNGTIAYLQDIDFDFAQQLKDIITSNNHK